MKKNYNLVGIDGNAYCIMGYVTRAMRDAYRELNIADFNDDAQDAYLKDAKSSNYDHLVAVSFEQIEKVNEAFKKA